MIAPYIQDKHLEVGDIKPLKSAFFPLFLPLYRGSYKSEVVNASDCRSRDREFDPGQVPYFRGDCL